MIARRRIAFPSVRFGGYERRLICCASRSNGPIRYWRRQISTVKASIATSIRASLTWLASAHLQRHLIEELRFADSVRKVLQNRLSANKADRGNHGWSWYAGDLAVTGSVGEDAHHDREER